MWDLLYYLACAGSISVVGYGFLYFVDRDRAEDIAQTVSWNAVKLYHKANLELEKTKRWCKTLQDKKRIKRNLQNINIKRDSDDETAIEMIEPQFEDDSESTTFIGYKCKDGSIYTSKDLENDSYFMDETFDLMLIKKETQDGEVLYKRLEDKSQIDINNCCFDKADKPFLQVEIEIISNERIAIHKNLTGFYIQGNKLLDTPFLKWYMTEFYSTNLDGEYTIHLIDIDINMLKLNSNEHIKLKQEKAYAVVSN